MLLPPDAIIISIEPAQRREVQQTHTYRSMSIFADISIEPAQRREVQPLCKGFVELSLTTSFFAEIAQPSKLPQNGLGLRKCYSELMSIARTRASR